MKAEFLTNVLHGSIFRQNLSRDVLQFFVLTDFDQTTQEFRAQPFTLEAIANQHRKLGFIPAMQFTQATETEKLMFAVAGSL
jgi:hypothetical protein